MGNEGLIDYGLFRRDLCLGKSEPEEDWLIAGQLVSFGKPALQSQVL